MSHKKAKLLRRLQRIEGFTPPPPSRMKMAGMSASMDAVESLDDLTPEQMDIYFPTLEELTDELITELINSGKYERKSLLEVRAMGLKYNRARNSFMDKPEGFGKFAKQVGELTFK